MTNDHIEEKDTGDCIETQEEPMAYHLNPSSGQGHGCLLINNAQITTNRLPMIGQLDDPGSTKE